MRLIHAADIHLGRRRLDGRLTDSDFARAFEFIAGRAVEAKAEVFLLAGDLFDRPQVEPSHLRQAQEVLARLKAAGIPVIAIAGNHDKAFINSTEPTWLDYLADDGLLILLGTRFGPEGPLMTEWSPETRRGNWIDVSGVRFVGAGYLGAATPFKVRQIVDGLETDRTHVLLLHAGPDYFVGEGGGFSREDLERIRGRVDYLALGHIHKPMIHDGWACNPGSPENCDLNESRYDLDKSGEPQLRGYAEVELDPEREEPLRSLEIRSNPRRPMVHLELDCTPFGNKLKHGAAELEKAACKLIVGKEVAADGVVALRLTGRVNLGRLALDPQVAARNIEEAAGVSAVALDASMINVEGPGRGGGDDAETVSREEIERAAVRALVDDEHLWGLDGDQGAIADLFFDLKEGIRLKHSAEVLAERVSASPLIERIREAMTAPGKPGADADETGLTPDEEETA